MDSYYDIKRVSSSSLKWFEMSPRYFKLKFDGAIEEEDQFKYKKGKIIHFLTLEPSKFDEEYMVLDYSIPKSQQQIAFCDHVARYKEDSEEELLLRAYKNAYVAKEKDEIILEKARLLANTHKDYIQFIKNSTTKSVITKEYYDYLMNIKSSLFNHKIASQLLFKDEINMFKSNNEYQSFTEYPIFWDYQNGVPCKSMIDKLIIDHENKIIKLVDLKTSSDIYDFKSKIQEYKYYRQLSFYWKAIESEFPELSEYSRETYIVAVNTKEPFEVLVYSVSNDTLEKGNKEIHEIMTKLKWHFDKDLWEYDIEYYEGTGIETI